MVRYVDVWLRARYTSRHDGPTRQPIVSTRSAALFSANVGNFAFSMREGHLHSLHSLRLDVGPAMDRIISYTGLFVIILVSVFETETFVGGL